MQASNIESTFDSSSSEARSELHQLSNPEKRVALLSTVDHPFGDSQILLHYLILDITGKGLLTFRTDLDVDCSYLKDQSIPKGEERC